MPWFDTISMELPHSQDKTAQFPVIKASLPNSYRALKQRSWIINKWVWSPCNRHQGVHFPCMKKILQAVQIGILPELKYGRCVPSPSAKGSLTIRKIAPRPHDSSEAVNCCKMMQSTEPTPQKTSLLIKFSPGPKRPPWMSLLAFLCDPPLKSTITRPGTTAGQERIHYQSKTRNKTSRCY